MNPCRFVFMTKDEQIGKNLARLRGDMTQKDLAAAMRARGFKWSQATVWSIEKGERPLRYSEAVQVTDLLDAGVYVLDEEDWESAVKKVRQRVQTASESLDAAMDEYEAARAALKSIRTLVTREEGVEFPAGHAVYVFDDASLEDRVRERAATVHAEAKQEAIKAEMSAEVEANYGVGQTEA